MSAAALPEEAAVLTALEATWPPEEAIERDGWRLRFAPGAGSRVNSARPLGHAPELSFDAVVDAYAARALTPMLQLRASPADQAIAAAAGAVGFVEFDPCLLCAVEIETVVDAPPPVDARVMAVNTPLAALETLWAQGDGGPERRAVMARAEGPSQVFAARVGDRLAGAVFASVAGGICFEHALHAAPDARRRGVGLSLMRAAARFGRDNGARVMAISVRRGNAPARALFERLGFRPVGGYAYWRREAG